MNRFLSYLDIFSDSAPLLDSTDHPDSSVSDSYLPSSNQSSRPIHTKSSVKIPSFTERSNAEYIKKQARNTNLLVHDLAIELPEQFPVKPTNQDLCNYVLNDSMSGILHCLKNKVDINAVTLVGKNKEFGIGWEPIGKVFKVVKTTNGGVPASALHYAAVKDRHAILVLLLKLHADKNLKVKVPIRLKEARKITPHTILSQGENHSPNAELLRPDPPGCFTQFFCCKCFSCE